MHTAIGDVSLVVEDTARNVQTVVDVMPVMAGQVKAIAEDFPTLSKQITAIQEHLRVCYAPITFFYLSGLSIEPDR